jgi:YHS domain-containing protein
VFLEQEGIHPRCIVDPTREAKLDSKLRTFVNYEVFFFCDEAALATFQGNPTRYCGLLTDPVSQQRFQPAPGSFRRDYMGRPYYFESDSTYVAFAATPDSFGVRRGM